jgi:hypothetical protein
MMTVAELIKELQALPQDIQIMMLDSDRESPVEIVQVSRGSWGETLNERMVASMEEDGASEDTIDNFDEYYDDEEFVQNDHDGEIVVLVTW